MPEVIAFSLLQIQYLTSFNRGKLEPNPLVVLGLISVYRNCVPIFKFATCFTCPLLVLTCVKFCLVLERLWPCAPLILTHPEAESIGLSTLFTSVRILSRYCVKIRAPHKLRHLGTWNTWKCRKCRT